MSDKTKNRRKFIPSPGDIGGKIKMIRKIRGLTQKELGIKCGFPEKTADIRIRQYELEDIVPQKDTIQKLADALEISVFALYDADFVPYSRMYHALFDLEDFHGLHPVQRPEGLYLEFEGSSIFNKEIPKAAYDAFLLEWYEMRKRYQPIITDSDKEKKEKRDAYILWKYTYSLEKVQQNNLHSNPEIERLQAEVDRLYAEVNSDKEIERIDSLMIDLVSDDVSDDVVVEPADIVRQIVLLARMGVSIEHYSPNSVLCNDINGFHVVSIKTDDIVDGSQYLSEIVALFRKVDALQRKGVGISRCITSRNKELYLTLTIPEEQYRYFEVMDDIWNNVGMIRGSMFNGSEASGIVNSILRTVEETISTHSIKL